MKVSFGYPVALTPEPDPVFDKLTTRYRAAFSQYQRIVARHSDLNRSGGKPSQQSLLDEERAFDELDCARQALLDAAALAHPTLH